MHVYIELENEYGGYIKGITNVNAVRYRLHNRAGLMVLVQDLNGLLNNPKRISQFKKVCAVYNVSYLSSIPLSYSSGYLSGLFDSDGSIYINIISKQVFITISQKSPELLNFICSIYGGKVYTANADHTAYKWTIYRKNDVVNLVDSYFYNNPCVSAKRNRFEMVKSFYTLCSQGAMKAFPESILGIAMEDFLLKWNNYEKVA